MDERQIDQELVERAQQGDTKAFEMLVVKYNRRLGRLLSRFIKDEHEVNDVVQESFIKAYRALPNFTLGCTASASTQRKTFWPITTNVPSCPATLPMAMVR